MKKLSIHLLLASVVLMISACASRPVSTSMLEQARMDYSQAQNNPKVATYAAAEMQSATEALSRASVAASRGESLETVDKLAYLAKQQIALTNEVASKKASDADIAGSAAIRDQVRLDQRTLEAQLAELAAKKTERGLIITLGDILFAVDQATLNADGVRMVQRLALVLQQNPNRTVLIEGHTDSTGTSQYNQVLSERRAMAVRDALLGLSVARGQVAVHGYGELYPIASNDTALNRQLNRRVEVVLSDERGVVSAR